MTVVDLGRDRNLALAVSIGKVPHGATKRQSVVFDFDGTLTEPGATWPDVGKPNKVMIDQLKRCHDAGMHVIIHTCRLSSRINPSDVVGDQTARVKDFLRINDVPYDQLWTSDKPLALLYIDDRSVDAKNIGAVRKAINKVLVEKEAV